MQQLISTEANSFALSAFFCVRQDPDNETNVDSLSPKWYTKLPYKKAYQQKIQTICEMYNPTELYRSLFLFFSHRFPECDYALEWPKKIKHHFIDLVLKDYVVELIDTAAVAENIAELILETPIQRKKLSLNQAKSLAITALEDAEKRRQRFAEQEARIASVWEIE